MSEILGHDIDGQPLRAGDRVVMTDVDMQPEWVGMDSVVVGVDLYIRYPKAYLILDDEGRVRPDTVRKLPPKADHEPGSWEEIAKLGWKPNLAPSTADC